MKIIADKNIPYVEDAFSDFGDVILKSGRDITSDEVRDADILLVRTVTAVNENLLKDSKVRFVGTATIGFDHIDVGYLKKRGIAFSSAEGCNANSVAEYIVAALFVLAERYGLNLQNIILGIVGVGNVGTKVLEKARALGMEVLLNDPPKARAIAEEEDVKPANLIYHPLDWILKEADIVSLHVPLTYEGNDPTYRMGNHSFFSRMKNNSFIINTARGDVVDTHALMHALYHGKVKSAVIDVWEGEPSISTELLDCIDIGTPHIAGYSRDGKANATFLLYQSACNVFGKKIRWKPLDLPPPRHPVIEVAFNGRESGRMLQKIIKQAYDIERDDGALRLIFSVPKNERAAFFDQLRNNYPVRREFHSMTIVPNGHPEEMLKTLKKLGFKLYSDRELD